jgi:hypothetical protein
MEHNHWVLRKSNAKNMDIDMERTLLQSYTGKEFEKQQKSDGYGGCFPSQPQFYYYSGLAYNQLAQFKKQKKCWKWDWIIL